MGKFVQYGCGLCAPASWENYDVSPNMRLQKVPIIGSFFGDWEFPPSVLYGDIRRGLPVADGSADAVYCSHVLEHLALSDFRAALRNTFRIIRPGGVFRTVLPDLRALAEAYVRSGEPGASIEFMRSTELGREGRPRGIRGLLKVWLGNSYHLWMWDYQSLASELESAGFRGVRRASFGDSSVAEFKDVEQESRWTHQLGVECHRPASAGGA